MNGIVKIHPSSKYTHACCSCMIQSVCSTVSKAGAQKSSRNLAKRGRGLEGKGVNRLPITKHINTDKETHTPLPIDMDIYIYRNIRKRKIRTPNQLTTDQSSSLQHCVSRSRYLQHLNTVLADPATYISTVHSVTTDNWWAAVTDTGKSGLSRLTCDGELRKESWGKGYFIQPLNSFGISYTNYIKVCIITNLQKWGEGWLG